MRLLDRIRRSFRGLPDAAETDDSPDSPVVEPADGHAPGHRHLGPPPAQGEPKTAVTEQVQNQPWIRRSHSDSQTRRFRR